VGLIVFFANAALLVLQMVAGRLLAPFVGSSLETWTSVIGVFLTGIALGNALGGRIADRYPSPRTLAILLGVGALAALWMVAFPMLGRVAGMVFSLSTLGCLLGNYLTGFVLMKTFPINELVFMSAGVLAVLGVGSLLLLGQPNPTPEVVEAREPIAASLGGTGQVPSDSARVFGTGCLPALLLTATLVACGIVAGIVTDSWVPSAVRGVGVHTVRLVRGPDLLLGDRVPPVSASAVAATRG
jgi:hypothetical protein